MRPTACVLSLLAMPILFSTCLANPLRGVHIKIYDNIAEITRPISPYADLPMVFSQQEWYDIRADSFRLVGDCVRVHAQIHTFNRTSLNGQKVLLKRDLNNDTYTEGIMIDESRNLVQDLVDNTFYTISSDRIRYLSIPPVHNYTVDFVLESLDGQRVYLRYLQNNIKWSVHYDLLLDEEDTNAILQAYASIRNKGDTSLTIDSTELLSGDVNIQQAYNEDTYDGTRPVFGEFVSADQAARPPPFGSVPTISSAEELVGVYFFRINETFILDPRSTYILPMFRPTIEVERYDSIDKYFSERHNRGNAQRAYRLRVEENFLPAGKVFVRESDRLVGETYSSDIAANLTNEFELGQDPDVQYIEQVRLDSRRNHSNVNTYPVIISTYTIDLQLVNNKQRPVTVEYRLKFASHVNLTLQSSTENYSMEADGESLIGLFELKATTELSVHFTFETQ